MTIKFNPMAKQHYRKQVNLLYQQQTAIAVRDRALKFYSSTKRNPVSINSSPAQQIEALNEYILDLMKLADELLEAFGDEAKDTLLRLQIERQHAIAQIGQLRIEAIKPE